MKKIISLLLTVLMALSVTTAVASVSAETTGKIYLEKPEQWAGTIFYTHIYEATGDMTSFFGWQSKKEKLTEEDGKLVYDLSVLDDYSAQLSGGLQSGKDYVIMFSDNLGNETCGIMFNTACIGDTAKVNTLDPVFENAVDSTKHSYEAEWTLNKDKYGIPLQITSVGTVQGKFISKGTTTADLINQWDKEYPDYPNPYAFSPQSSAIEHKARLAELKDVLAKMASNGEILYVGGGVYKDAPAPAPTPHPTLVLSKKTGSVYVKGTLKTPFKVYEPYGKTTFSTSDSKVAKVSASGVITGVKAGKAVITVKHYKSSAKFTVTVKNPTLNKKSVTIKKNKTFTLKVTGKVGKATFKSSNKKIATVNGSGKITAKKKGSATITVKTNGITLKCKVKVK